MLAIAGTIPDESFPLIRGKMTLKGEDTLVIGGTKVPLNRGTPALAGAVIRAGEILGLDAPEGILVGDIGRGQGSRKLYSHLTETLPEAEFSTLVFHYLQPDVDWHNRILFAVDAMAKRPKLIADAGFMYAAKMSGQAPSYDLFTPDVGELSFLADEAAPHPFYTRGFILHQDNQVPDLIARACQHGNSARHLLVKGSCDYVVCDGNILAQVDQPSIEAMEAVGGTGDTLTGMVSALVETGRSIPDSARIAAMANRLAGALSHPTPASQVADIIHQIPEALSRAIKKTGVPGNMTSDHSDPTDSTPAQIQPHMTVLDTVAKYRSTETVFKQWDEKAGECICCNALFESIETVAAKYNIDLNTLLGDLEKAVLNATNSNS